MLFRRVFLILFLVSSLVFSEENPFDQKPLNISCGNVAFSRLDFRHREHKGMGFNQGYTTAALYLFPNKNTSFTPFFNGNIHLFNNLYLASNLGAGLRFTDDSENVTLGINGYYDYRNFKSLTTHQAASGIEILSRWINFRANAYFPFNGKRTDDHAVFNNFDGNRILLQQKVRYAFKQVDAEIAFELPGFFQQVNLEMGLGYYYLFQRKSPVSSVGPTSGGRVRFKAEPIRQFSIAVEYTYDKIFHSRVNGTVSFNIPLGPSKIKGSTVSKYPYKKSKCDIYYEQMNVKTQDVVRNEIIPMLSKTVKFPHLTEAGFLANIIFVNNTGESIPLGTGVSPSGNGTFLDPFTTIAQANAAAKINDIIYVDLGDGTTNGYDTGFILQGGQTLTSSGIDINLDGIIVPASTPGQFAKLTNSSGNVILATNNNTTSLLQGFDIEGTSSGHAVNILGSAVEIKNNTVEASGNYSAINIADAKGDSFIEDNTVSNTDGTTGVGLIQINRAQDLSRGKLTIRNNTVNASGGHDGLRFEELAKVLVIKNNNITSTSTSGNGVYISDTSRFFKTLEFSDNNITSGFETGLNIDWNNEGKHDLSIQRTNITSSSATTGFLCSSQSKNGTLLLSDSTIKNVDGVGVNIISEGKKAELLTTISGNTIASSGNAIELESGASQTSSTIIIDSNTSIQSTSGKAVELNIAQASGALDIEITNNADIQSKDICIDFANATGGFDSSIYLVTGNTMTCKSDTSAFNLSARGTNFLTVSDNNIVYSGTTLTTPAAINLATSSTTLLTSTFNINDNSLSNSSLATLFSVASSDNARTIISASQNMNSSKTAGKIVITQKGNQPVCADVTNNFNALIGSSSTIDFTNSGTGTLQIISSTAPTKNGIASSNNMPTANVTISGSSVIAPVGTDCPPFEAVFVDNSTKIPTGVTRNGSFAYPYADMKKAFSSITTGDFLYIRPGTGNYSISANSGAAKGSTILEVLDKQQIIGSGTSVIVAGTKVAPLDPGTKPKLNFQDNSFTFVGVEASANTATIQGLELFYNQTTSGGATKMLAVSGSTEMTISENSFVLNYPNSSSISYGLFYEMTGLNQTIENNTFDITTKLSSSGESSEVMHLENIQAGGSGTIAINNNTASFNNKGVVIGSATSSGTQRTYTLKLSENTFTNTLPDTQRVLYDFAQALNIDLTGNSLSVSTLEMDKNNITSSTVLTLAGTDSNVKATIENNSLFGVDLQHGKSTNIPLFTVVNEDTKAAFNFNNNIAKTQSANTTVQFTNESKTNYICQTTFKGNFFKKYEMLKKDTKKDKDIVFFVSKSKFESDQKQSSQSNFSQISGATFNNVVCPN